MPYPLCRASREPVADWCACSQGWQNRIVRCHTAIRHRAHVVPHTCLSRWAAWPHQYRLPPSYCPSCSSAKDVCQDCSPLSFWTSLLGSLPVSPLLAALTPPFHVAVPKKTGHSGTRLTLPFSPQSHFLQQGKTSSRCTRVSCLLDNISSWSFKTHLVLPCTEPIFWAGKQKPGAKREI